MIQMRKFKVGGKWKVEGGNNLSTSRLPLSTKRSAFTLIEMIGVMALIAILAAVAVPPLISRLETVDSAKEDANLEEIGRALAEGIKATGTIPNPASAAGVSGSWTAIASNYTFLAPRLLATNFPARNARQIIFSPDLTSFVDTNGFVTPARGWPDPLPAGDMRIYILASSKRNLPLLSGIPVADIADWDKVYSNTGVIPVPSSVFGPNQTNKGEFLHVTSVNLRPLFCRVELIDTAAPEDIAGFNVAVAGVGYTPSSSVMVSYLNNNITFQTLPADTFTDTSGNGTWDLGEAYNDINADGAYNNTGALNNTIIPTLSLASSYNARHLAIANTVIPPGTAEYAGPASPNAPTYDMYAALGPGAGDFLPSPDPTPPAGLGADHNQTQTFYVLKGQAINLFNGAGVLDKSVVIQSDVQYKYYNNTWTRVD